MNDNQAKLFTIGELARTFDLTLRTLRFYEEAGLLHPTHRGTVRYFSAADRVRLEMIQKGKRLGFSLRSIKMMLDAGPQWPSDKVDICALAGPEAVEQRIVQLENQRAQLEEALRELKAALANGPEQANVPEERRDTWRADRHPERGGTRNDRPFGSINNSIDSRRSGG